MFCYCVVSSVLFLDNVLVENVNVQALSHSTDEAEVFFLTTTAEYTTGLVQITAGCISGNGSEKQGRY